MGAGAGGLSAEQLDRMASEGAAFVAAAAEGKAEVVAALAPSLQKFIMMRKVGVPPAAVLQQLSLRRDITDAMVRDFLAWCAARPGSISREDVLTAFPSASSSSGGNGGTSSKTSGDLSNEACTDLDYLRQALAHDPSLLSKFCNDGDDGGEKVHLLAAAMRSGDNPNVWVNLTENFAGELQVALAEARRCRRSADEVEALILDWINLQDDPTERVVAEYLMHTSLPHMRKMERRARRREDRERQRRENADIDAAAAATKVGGR